MYNILLNVDNFLIAKDYEKNIDTILHDLMHISEMKGFEDANLYLRIGILWDNTRIYMHHTWYIQKLVEMFGIKNYNSLLLPNESRKRFK